MANLLPRVDYDVIAPLYDSQAYRARTVDPEFLAFIEQHASSQALSLLDISCGTGNQLVANRTAAPHVKMIGVDRSLGMLRRAWPKAPDIAWVQADAAALPFLDQSFDFISCQFAFHHFQAKASMLRDTFRVLRAGPHESADWIYYEYFPQAEIIDLRDFWPPDAMVAVMEGIGFKAVTVEHEHLYLEQDLSTWVEIVRCRDTCSQLLAIPEEAYEAGVRRLERELGEGTVSRRRAGHFCLLTVRGKKPSQGSA